MSFRVGQKVVCVNAEPSADGYKVALIEGAVYTIIEIVDHAGDRRCVREDTLGIILCEVQSPPYRIGFYGEFSAHRFRPVVERKTNISIFTRMLTPGLV